jgi:hypothetical protein
MSLVTSFKPEEVSQSWRPVKRATGSAQFRKPCLHPLGKTDGAFDRTVIFRRHQYPQAPMRLEWIAFCRKDIQIRWTSAI